MKIMIAAGGSGGHLLPAQQLASQLKGEIVFAGHRLDSSPFFRKDLFAFRSIRSAPVRRSLPGLFYFFKETLCGIVQSIRLIYEFRPDIVVGFGSFHSFPVLGAAFLMRRKIVLFEANCLLGKVNRLFARDAQIVASQFLLKSKKANVRLVPLLPWGDASPAMDRASARKEGALTFLVFGGSQGAAFLNRTIPLCVPAGAQVIHLAGSDEAARDVRDHYHRLGIQAVVKGFESDMPKLYAAADFAICRSGAGTLAELIRSQIPALLIPFPFAADDHQSLNAEFLVNKVGGATMLAEGSATPDAIAKSIQELIRESKNMRSCLDRFRAECANRTGLSQQIMELGTKI